MVSVDLAALRSIEREKEIPFEHLLGALETALLSAYKHTPHSMPHARVDIDRKTGEVVVWAQDLDADGGLVEEYDDTPTDFGRVAAMTARQVILQRLRDAEHDQTFGEYSGREGDIVTGVVQADAQAAAARARPRRHRQDRGRPAAVGAGARRAVHARHPAARLCRRASPAARAARRSR